MLMLKLIASLRFNFCALVAVGAQVFKFWGRFSKPNRMKIGCKNEFEARSAPESLLIPISMECSSTFLLDWKPTWPPGEAQEASKPTLNGTSKRREVGHRRSPQAKSAEGCVRSSGGALPPQTPPFTGKKNSSAYQPQGNVQRGRTSPALPVIR